MAVLPHEKKFAVSLISPIYWTDSVLYYGQKPKGKVDGYVSDALCGGHVQVYDRNGKFLFSADTEREAREEMEDYAESAA